MCSTRSKLPGKHTLFFHSRPQRATVRGLHPICVGLIPGRKRLMLRTSQHSQVLHPLLPHREHLCVCPALLGVGTCGLESEGIMGTGASAGHVGTLAPAFLSSVLKGPSCYLRAWMFCELLSWDLPIALCSRAPAHPTRCAVTLPETTRQVHRPYHWTVTTAGMARLPALPGNVHSGSLQLPLQKNRLLRAPLRPT